MYIEHTDVMFKKKQQQQQQQQNNLLWNCYKNKEDKILVATL